MIIDVHENISFDNEKMYIIQGKYKRYLYEQRQGEFPGWKERRKKGYPTIIFLSATSCNLKCRYCYAKEGSYNDISNKRQMDFDDYVYVYKTAKYIYGGVQAMSFFGGEPLLNFEEIKKFAAFLENEEEELPPLGLLSNGTIMSGEIKNFIRRYRIAFGTSLDGPQKINDFGRYGDSKVSVFDLVVKNLRELEDIPVPKAVQFTFSYQHLKGYTPGDVIAWAKEMEKLPIDSYEFIGVTSDAAEFKIDLENEAILTNYTLLCEELADHCLDLYISEETTVMPHIFAGIILSICKREYQRDCSAGFSFSVSPDRIAYPCHVCAGDRSLGVNFDENFLIKSQENEDYQRVKGISRKDIGPCQNCIAKNICPFICKALIYQNNNQLLQERCLMMQIFTRKVIVFLANNYKQHKNAIDRTLRRISAPHQR